MTTRQIPQRNDLPPQAQWDLTPLFEDERHWDKLRRNIEDRLGRYNDYRGKLAQSVEIFISTIELDLDLSRQLDRLYTYAQLRHDEDQANDRHAAMQQQAVNLASRAAAQASFITPEIQSLPQETIERYRKDPRLRAYQFYLQKILRYKPHTLDQDQERILAMTQEMAQGPYQVFGQLDNVDLGFGTLADADGNQIELSHGNFLNFLIQPQRKLRRRAFFQYYDAYHHHRHTLAAILTASVKKDHFYARVRNFSSCRAAALFPDNIPETLYDNLLATVKDRLAPLFDYFQFRRQALELPRLHFYDTYVPMVGPVELNIPYEQAVALCLEALKPLGQEYTEILRQGLFEQRWVDRYENKGKRSGAYSSGCYDSPPYILLNYQERNLNSLYTLIHEAGHSMHSYLAKTHQPYVDHRYTIFVAEVASTFNENLLTRHLLQVYRSEPRMMAFVLNREIDNIRATLFRQTMFAEFELRLHQRVEQNDPLTLETITATYAELLQLYFGDTMAIDEALHLEGLRIPHFYSAYYVYKYATGLAAAIALAERLTTSGPEAVEAYLAFLKLGGSRFPLDSLRQAGVDMRKPLPIIAAIDYFERLVQQLKALYPEI